MWSTDLSTSTQWLLLPLSACGATTQLLIVQVSQRTTHLTVLKITVYYISVYYPPRRNDLYQNNLLQQHPIKKQFIILQALQHITLDKCQLKGSKIDLTKQKIMMKLLIHLGFCKTKCCHRMNYHNTGATAKDINLTF